MSDKMIRMAARKPNGTATPVSTDADGRIITNRTWKKTWTSLTALEIRDTDAHDFTAVDLRDVPICSLRFQNELGVPVTVYFKTDVNTSNGYALVNKDGQSISITLQPIHDYEIITPEDLPILKYIQYLRIRVVASSAPSSGALSCAVVEMV